MAKIGTQTYPLLEEGRYRLRIKGIDDPKESEYQGEAQLQCRAELEVVEPIDGHDTMSDGGNAIGFVYEEYWGLDPNTRKLPKNGKFWLIYEAATGMKLDIDDEIDTDDLKGKEFEARVVVNGPGTRNRTEHETFKKAGKSKRIQTSASPKSSVSETPADEELDPEEGFDSIPF